MLSDRIVTINLKSKYNQVIHKLPANLRYLRISKYYPHMASLRILIKPDVKIFYLEDYPM